MKKFKKMEVYINDEKKGMLNINIEKIKKAMQNSAAGLLIITTLTGCSINTKTIETPKEIVAPISYSSLDEQIEIQEAFLSDIYDKIDPRLQTIINSEIIETVKKISQYKEMLDPNSEAAIERTLLYPELTDEQIKENIINSYIDVIDKVTKMIEPYFQQDIDYEKYANEYQKGNTKGK